MAEVDQEPAGYRCQCGHIRLEHVTGGKLCMVTGCECKRFRASPSRVQAPIEPTQEDENMTVHAVPRDEFNQTEPSEFVLANGSDEPEASDEVDGDETEKPSVLERIAEIRRNKEGVLKEFASQEAALLDSVRAKLAVARLEVQRLEDAEAGILEAMGADKPSRQAPAVKAAATRKARAAKPAADGTFQAKLVSWVVAHPKSTLDDIAQAFPKEKRATISSRLYLAKKAETLKTTGTRGSMKWSGA
jgi:hypothetical protein